MLERAARTARALPWLTQVGLAALLAGLAIDVLAHIGWTSALAAGHVVTLVGMVLAVAGVLTLAYQHPERSSRKGGRE